jgi:hypothetical protein
MARSYAAAWNATNTQSATVPIMTLTGAATIRPAIYDIIHGSDATPADNAGTFLMRRHTTAPASGTAITPAPIDPANPASLASAMMGPSIGAPTLTANTSVLQWAQNQRATFRWVAAPGKELYIPATANNGLSLLPTVVGGSAVNQVGVWEYEE